jgi:hypothetical protein
MLRNSVHLIFNNNSQLAFGGNMRRKMLRVDSPSAGTPILVGLGYTPGGSNFDFVALASSPVVLWRDQVGDAITEAVYLFCSGAGQAGSATEFFDS